MIDNVNLPTLNAEGKVKVELFDDLTGRKIEEIKTENFIAKGMDYLYRLAMISIFTDGRYTGGTNLYDSFNDQFEYMVLTDANHPENPLNEWLVRGRLIGFAYTDRTYSGSDRYQGSYNANESFTNNERVHIVIDFPTHAANGTFQSIYFLYNGYVFDYNDFFDRPFGSIRSVQRYNNDFYVLSGDGRVFMRYDENFNQLGQWTLRNSSPSYNRDFVIRNEYIYIANESSSYSSMGILRVPLSEPDSANIEQIYNDKECYGITHDGTYFYVSTEDDEIIQFNNNFNVVEIYEPKTHTGDTIRDRMYADTDGTILLENYTWDKGNNLTYTGEIDLRGFIDDEKIIDASGQLVPKKAISSRALLDSPVTKTSNNTMKITYDFMLPSLFE